jgi:hypothetical protein
MRETGGNKQQFKREDIVPLFSNAHAARAILHGHDLHFIVEVGRNIEGDYSSCVRPLNSFVVR